MNDVDVDQFSLEVHNLIEEGQFDLAIERLDGFLPSDATNAQLLFMKGIAHGAKGEKEQAVAAYTASAEHAGEMAALPLYNLANLYKDHDDLREAVECYQKVVDIDPTMADAWINMGGILDDNGLHEGALLAYEAALAIDTEDPMTWSNRGNSLRSLGRLEEAEESYRRALTLDKEDYAAGLGIGVCMVHRGDEKGLELVEQAYATSRNTVALGELALCLARLDRFEDALECFDAIAESGENNPPLWNNHAECLAKLGRVDEALKSFDRSIECDDEYSPAFFGKARVLVSADRMDEARETTKRLAEVADEEFLKEPPVRLLLSLCRS